GRTSKPPGNSQLAGRLERHATRSLILVDSSVWIDFFRAKASPQTARLESLLGSHPIAIGDLMLVEVLQGFATDYDFHRTRRLMESLQVVNLCGRDLAVKAARNYRSLRGTQGTVVACGLH